MRKIMCTTLITIGLGIAGTALAAHDPHAGPGAHDGMPGNQGCDAVDANGAVIPIKNPGKLFQLIRGATGLNPKQWADALNTGLGTDHTVGEWIDLRCDDPAV